METLSNPIRVFLCGDVMLGRGIDQIFPYPSDPRLHEQFASSALAYLELAERANGPVPRPCDLSYVWGDALDHLRRVSPDVRLVNLETSITTSDDYAPKGINYRMSPHNVGCLTAAGIDCCVLANNHVLDWGRDGLVETLETLELAGIQTAGAGRSRARAERPATFALPGGARVLIFAVATPTSGTPLEWTAEPDRPGVNVIPDLSESSIAAIANEIGHHRRAGDIVILSIHWGSNWGYEIPSVQRRFAHEVIERAGVSIVHGHSSHHPKAIEVHKRRLILYGCGDFLNDYEGIAGYGEFRGDLTLMYFADLDRTSGDLVTLEMAPMRLERFRLTTPAEEEVLFLQDRLNTDSHRFGVNVERSGHRGLVLSWGCSNCKPSYGDHDEHEADHKIVQQRKGAGARARQGA